MKKLCLPVSRLLPGRSLVLLSLTTLLSATVAKAQYCAPTYSSGCSGDNIATVTLGTLADVGQTCTPVYADRTTAQTGATPTLQIPTVTAGQNSTLTITFGSDGNQYTGVWIDFNQNNTFEATEFFTNGNNAGSSGTANITLAIPAGALGGNTMMRIRGGVDAQPLNTQACGTTASSWGSARDYRVNVIPVSTPPGCIAGPTSPANGSGACMTATGTTLSWPATPITSSYDVYLDMGTASTLVGNVSSASYTTPAVLAAGSYSWKIIPKNPVGDATGCSTFTFTVNPLPPVSVTPTSGVFCTSGAVTLTASGANNYAWSPAGGLSSTSGASVTANPSAGTTYTVTGSDMNGCTSTAITTVSPINVVTPTASNQTVCAGAAASINVSPVVPATGTMEYELTDTTGTVVAPWQASTAFSITPIANGSNKYFIFARNSNCPADLSDTGTVVVFSGFTATVTTNNASCANGDGSIVVSNPAGAGLYNGGTWYSNDFSTAAFDTNMAVLRGGALVTGSALQLTPNTGSQNGGLLIKNPMAIAQHVDSVKFILTIPQNGADGVSWSFADNIVYDGGSSLEAGAGNKLIVAFDAYGTSGAGINGIYLTYGQAGGNAINNTVTSTMLAYSNNTSWRGTSNVPVAIYITPAGKLTLKVGSTTIFNQVQLPAAYVSANRSTWQHLFAARTGGVSEQHVIDNVSIAYSGTSFVYGKTTVNAGAPPASWQSSSTFSGLTGGDSLDIWIAHPTNTSCNRKLGTYSVSAPVVTSLTENSAPGCPGGSDGFLALKVITPGTYSATYVKNGGSPVSVSGLGSQSNGSSENIVIPDLGAGSYTNVKVTSSANCISNTIAGPVVIGDPAITTLATASYTATAAQSGAGMQYYTDASCGAIAGISTTNNLGSVNASVTVGTTPVSTGSSEPFLGRYYEITPAMNAGMPVAITLYFSQNDFNNYNASSLVGGTSYPAITPDGSNLRIRAYHGFPGSGTTGPNGSYDAANSDLLQPASVVLNSHGFWEVAVSSPNGFSGFFANTNTDIPLDLVLGDLKVINEGAVNQVYWESLKEANGDHFEIERSKDARSFVQLATVAAKGFPGNYRFTDQQPAEGANYYRLHLVNADGGGTYSKIVRADAAGAGFSFDVFPNPVQHELGVYITRLTGTGTIEVADMTGRVVTRHQVLQNGKMSISTKQLPAGTYLVKYKDDTHTASVKITKY